MGKRKNTEPPLRRSKLKNRDIDPVHPTETASTREIHHSSGAPGMTRHPSDRWEPISTIDARGKLIDRVLRAGNFSFLSSQALLLRRNLQSIEESEAIKDSKAYHAQQRGADLTCSINTTKFTAGFNNVVFELTFSDSVSWIVRIRLPRDEELDEEITQSMLSELSVMKVVREKTSVPVPQIYGYDVERGNPFGFRYMLMEAIPGRILDGPFSKHVPPEHKKKVATQLADYYFQISTLQFDKIGLVWCGENLDRKPYIIARDDGQSKDANGATEPFSTSLEYFYTLRQIANASIMNDHPDDVDWATACWVMKQALPDIVITENVRGPFPLCHPDFHYGNILLDDDYNVVAIIDWTDAQSVPLERFAVIPEFVLPPAATAERKESITEFCTLFVHALREKEQNSIHSGSQTCQSLLSEIVGTPRMELVYRCTCFRQGLAKHMAQLVMSLLYGETATWESMKAFYQGSRLAV